jgi:hypothetical protein
MLVQNAATYAATRGLFARSLFRLFLTAVRLRRGSPLTHCRPEHRPAPVVRFPGHLGDARAATGTARAPSQLVTTTDCGASSSSGEGRGYSKQPGPQKPSCVRRNCLLPAQPHRAHVLPSEGFATHCNPLRQARDPLRRGRRTRRDPLVDESGAYLGGFD